MIKPNPTTRRYLDFKHRIQVPGQIFYFLYMIVVGLRNEILVIPELHFNIIVYGGAILAVLLAVHLNDLKNNARRVYLHKGLIKYRKKETNIWFEDETIRREIRGEEQIVQIEKIVSGKVYSSRFRFFFDLHEKLVITFVSGETWVVGEFVPGYDDVVKRFNSSNLNFERIEFS